MTLPATTAVLVLARMLVPAAGGDFAAEYRKAEGRWRVTAMTMNGEEIPTDGFKDLRIVLEGKTVKAMQANEVLAGGRYKVVSVTGKAIAFDLTMSTGPDTGKTFPALNEWLGDDELRTTIGQPGKPRPKPGATPEKGDRQAVFVIRREKK